MEAVRYIKRGRGFVGRNSNYFTEKKHNSEGRQHKQTPIQSLEGWILFIANLHEETSEDDIKEAFSEYGDVKNINLNLDRRTGFVKGYALVEYETYEEANAARECMNDSELLGVTIRVNWGFVTKPYKNEV